VSNNNRNNLLLPYSFLKLLSLFNGEQPLDFTWYQELFWYPPLSSASFSLLTILSFSPTSPFFDSTFTFLSLWLKKVLQAVLMVANTMLLLSTKAIRMISLILTSCIPTKIRVTFLLLLSYRAPITILGHCYINMERAQRSFLSR
jgi:hypothetical protein